jgi:dihydropteroate synthase
VISIVGILNCTPDSFSDGDPDLTPKKAYERALQLIDEGADLIDVGGDSTRPGSTCVDLEEEWQRIGSLIERLAVKVPISVDTHKAEIARRAIECGAKMINDVGAGADPDMARVVAGSNAQYVFMFSATGAPHVFSPGLSISDPVVHINEWLLRRAEYLQDQGIPAHRLIADTGMGGFVSADAAVSLEILKSYGDVWSPPGGLLFGCSRKGFLKRPGEHCISERDTLSCLYGVVAAGKLKPEVPVYIRVHNVALQRACLEGSVEVSDA